MRPSVRAVALHEFVTNVRRPAFLLVTFGMPLLSLGLIAVSLLGALMGTDALERPKAPSIGVYSPPGGPRLAGLASRSDKTLTLEVAPSLEQGLAAVRARRLKALVALDRDYMATGGVAVYRDKVDLLSQKDQLPLRGVLVRVLLCQGGTDPAVERRLLAPAGEVGAQTFVPAARGGFKPWRPEEDAARVVTPYLFSALFLMAIFVSAGYLLRGVADEKENRVIEVILSSVTPEDLLAGKLVGLGGVGLLQVGVWLGMAAVPASIWLARSTHLSPITLVAALLFFVLGYGLYATLMAGLGALGTSHRETQQIASGVAMLAMWPWVFMLALLASPNGVPARVLSYIPFTAPITMILRLATATVPWWDMMLSAALLAASWWLSWRLSVRLFRFGLLIYGKRPTFREVWRYLRTA